LEIFTEELTKVTDELHERRAAFTGGISLSSTRLGLWISLAT